MKTPNEWNEWIEEAISKNYLKYYDYKHFSNFQVIGSGGFGMVYRANWKNFEQYLALKSFYINNVTVKEIVHELKLQREVDFHNNVIRLYGITESETVNNSSKEYLLVLEYADGGSLRNYLKKNFSNLTWNDKFNLAYQLASAVSCLHDENILHHDLHSGNVLINQNVIKLADFGLSRRIEDATKDQSKLFGLIPYIDPKGFSKQKDDDNLMQVYKLNNKSDVYSVGVLLWEISSGQTPFCTMGQQYDIYLALEISGGLREVIVPNTPHDYAKLYTECWDKEPDKRPEMKHVVESLKAIMSNTNDLKIDHLTVDRYSFLLPKNDKSSLHEALVSNISGFNNMDPIELIVCFNEGKVNEIVTHISKETNEGKELKLILDYFNNSSKEIKEVYDWLLNNQNDQNNQNNSNCSFLLGYFNYNGIIADENKIEAFNLFDKASKQDHVLAQDFLGLCYQDGHGVTKDEKAAFKCYEKIADKDCAIGLLHLGYCYGTGIGVEIDVKLAASYYEKAANKGNINAIYNLGNCYRFGKGVEKNDEKAFKLFEKLSIKDHLHGITMLGFCYSNGIGTDVNKQKAFELYRKAANLDDSVAQYNLAEMFEKGYGIKKNRNEAIVWYKKSANQKDQDAQNRLSILEKRKRFNSFKKIKNIIKIFKR